MVILAGDIGGTKTVLSLYRLGAVLGNPLHQAVFASRDYPEFAPLLKRFLAEASTSSVQYACFGIAGPVIAGRCQTTNLPWVLDERDLARELNARQVRLLNDVEAAAYGTMHVAADELCPLTSPTLPDQQGHRVLLSAGTGLGQAILCWDGRRYHPMASEGGHADFAPQSEVEVALLGYLTKNFGHVSYERILSGPGLFNLYSFCRDTGSAQEPAWLRDKLAAGDRNAVVAEVGLADGHLLCTQALDLFVRIYGSAAGNLALHALALGGVYLGGGIAPKILPKLQDGSFLRSFQQKGRYQQLLSQMRVHVCLNPRTPLIGAAHFARQLSD
jgi:glucokinase